MSGNDPSKSPDVLLRVPLAGAEKVFCTQVEVPALTIGSHGPKMQLVSEQFWLLPLWPDVRPLTV